ncbi:MAG: cbb3-type cytochrome oxidase assembly protein CcoS [Planctomycetes bacterium]|nr:cbb3-type cytochrome oxidase assembly protein CcoS [Planctomycetota bacterium]
MNLIYLILPIALLIAAGFVFAFVWATRQGQFDDMDTPSLRVLGEDDEIDVGPAKKVESNPPGTTE